MSDVDPILLSVFARAFKSITDEMSISLQQTARSPILCEAKDFVTGLYDASGNMLEQTENLPILAFSLAPVCKYIVEYFGDEIYPGDVIFHNDVFSMGNQNNDVAAYKPIFVDDKLVAWSACKGHQADIGGAVAGGYNPNAVEVWQEGLRIPPVKVYERGKLRKDVWDLIFANIRFDIVQEDMRAEMGSCTVGERRMIALLKKYGRQCFEDHKQALFDATRKMMEAEIEAVPDGVYKGEGYVYYDGRNKGSKYTIRVKITVDGIAKRKPDHIIISPGPCTPNEAGKSVEIIDSDEELKAMPIMKVECPKCHNHEAYFWEVQTRAADEPATKFQKCTKCKHVWRDYL